MTDHEYARRYSYRVRWDEREHEFVATVDEFPSLSWCSARRMRAIKMLTRAVVRVLQDMRTTGEVPPKAAGVA